ncbi:hypothetical protein CMT41_02245 [Colwellia sp. MT41]|nr:hypothetical protein CMT41_02245 [Colwellia sp. MT41]
MFIESFTGTCAGAQKVSLNVIKCLSADFDVSLIKRNALSDYDDKLVDYRVDGFLPNENYLKKIYGSGDFLKNLTLIKTFTVFFTFFTCNFYTLFRVLKLKPAYIYTYDPRGLFLGCLFLRIFGFQVVWHLHSKLPKNKFIKSLMMALCTKIIVPSKAIADSLNGGEKVSVIYNGFDFTLPDKPKRKNLPIKILFLGTPHPHKGVHNLLQAIRIVEQKIDAKDIVLNVFGPFERCDDDYKRVIDGFLADIKDIEVEFKGWTNNAEKEIFASDLLVFPSVIEQQLALGGKVQTIKSSEALPTVLIESLAMGVPVVATNTPGVSEIITSPNDGIIISESDPEEMAKAIELILNQLDDFKPDKKYVFNKFSLKTMNSQLVKVFKFTA